MSDHLIIFDTTLRDGEQSPGASMTREEKTRIARQLERLRVDVIEAGFPASSNGDFAAVHDIAKAITESTVCALARANENDVRRAGEALKPAKSMRIHTFIASSPIHMQMKLRMAPEQVLEQAVKAVRWAREYTDNVEFSPEDAGRSEPDFLCRLLEAAIAAGATTVNIPDTVGYTMPWQFGALIASLRERIPNADRAVWSVHCHNDLGVAVANSLAAVMQGARQIECTINGLGERAGNASLEEIVMAVRTRKDVFACTTRIDTTQIVAASKLVSGITGFPVQPNKAIVGANAFAGTRTSSFSGSCRAATHSRRASRRSASSCPTTTRSTRPSRVSRSSPTRKARCSTRTCTRSRPRKASCRRTSTTGSPRSRSRRKPAPCRMRAS